MGKKKQLAEAKDKLPITQIAPTNGVITKWLTRGKQTILTTYNSPSNLYSWTQHDRVMFHDTAQIPSSLIQVIKTDTNCPVKAFTRSV